MAWPPGPAGPGEGPRGQGVGAGGVVGQVGIIGLPLQGRFELRERLVLPCAQLGGNHHGEGELGALRGRSLLEFRQVVQGFLLLPEPGVDDGPVLAGGLGSGSLLDHDVEIVEGLAVFAELDEGQGPSQPGVQVVGLGLERLLRRPPGRGRARSCGARRRYRRGHAHIDQRGRRHACAWLAGEVALRQVPVALGGDAAEARLAPDAGVPRPAVGPAQGVQRAGDQLGRLQGLLVPSAGRVGRPDVQPGIVAAGGSRPRARRSGRPAGRRSVAT